MSNQAFYREPFAIGAPARRVFPTGYSVSDIVRSMAPGGFEQHGVVLVGGIEVPKAMWPFVRPKHGEIVHLEVRLQGGDGDKGVALFAAVASIGLAVFSAGIAGGSAARFLGARFAAGTVGAYGLAGAVSIAGSFLLQALLPSPSLGRGPESLSDRSQGAASARGNVLEPNGPIPRVIGTRKIFPPLATPPRVEYRGQDEFVEAIYVLAGPHEWTDIQIDGTPIAEAEDVDFETREGWGNDPSITVVSKQARVAEDRIEMSAHRADPDDQSQPLSINDVPEWHGVSSGYDVDRVHLHLNLPQGLSKGGSTTTLIRVPFKMRMKPESGGAWIDLPEFHYVAARTTPTRISVRLEFYNGSEPNISLSKPTTSGFLEARNTNADSYFSKGSGDDYLISGNEGSSDVDHTYFDDDELVFTLDKATFSDEKYQIEIKRGAALLDGSYVTTTYLYDSESIDFFALRTSDALPESRQDMVDAIYIIRSVSEWDAHPISRQGFALLAIRAKNRALENVSAVASGYVRDWGGSAWDNWTTTSNPAPHYRDVLTGMQNFDPVPGEIVDDTDLLLWRTRCATEGYTCDHIAEGDTIADLLRVIAGCGYAKPYQSEVWGIIYDRDRSGEVPVQLFTSRNSRNFELKKALGRMPDGLRVNYPKNTGDNTNDQVIVPRPAGSGGVRYDQVTYDGMVNAARVEERALYDIKQLELRSTIYTLDAPAEAVVCRRGDLVAVETDILSTVFAAARITAVGLSGGVITSIDIDATVDVLNSDDILSTTDMLAVVDVLSLGLQTGVAVRDRDGDIHILPVTSVAGETQTLTVGGSFDIGVVNIGAGDLVSVGTLGQEYLRMIVSDIEPSDDMIFELSLVDEAQEIWT